MEIDVVNKVPHQIIYYRLTSELCYDDFHTIAGSLVMTTKTIQCQDFENKR